jgi:hypothetical protein
MWRILAYIWRIARYNSETLARAGIAVTVIIVTWLLTNYDSDIVAQWEAVFLMVIAYYFKERHAGNGVLAQRREVPAPKPQNVELIAQFVIAVGLVVLTTLLFLPRTSITNAGQPGTEIGNVSVSVQATLQPEFGSTGTSPAQRRPTRQNSQQSTVRDMIAGAWVGGVTLALAFYFKDVKQGGTTPLHEFFRSTLAAAVAIGTLIIVLFRHAQEPFKSALPVQWVALAFIVFGFYFKERAVAARKSDPIRPAAPPAIPNQRPRGRKRNLEEPGTP